MNRVELKITGSLPGTIVFELMDENEVLSIADLPVKWSVEEIITNRNYFRQVLPLQIVFRLQQWALDSKELGILAISSSNSELDSIPWEFIPEFHQLPTILIVRICESLVSIDHNYTSSTLRILAAGWSGKPWFDLPGIQKELNSLSSLNVESDINLRVLSEPSQADFVDAYRTVHPEILHMIPSAIQHTIDGPEIALAGNNDIEWIHVESLISQLENHQPLLVMVNTCDTTTTLRTIVEHLGCIAVGWLGKVTDLVAVDYTRFFYNRLFEGVSIIDAIHSYRSIQPTNSDFEQPTRHLQYVPEMKPFFKPIPVVFTPALTSLLDSPMKSQREERPVMRGSQPRSGVTRSYEPRASDDKTDVEIPTIAIEFDPQPWINPALLMNGRSAIVHLALSPNKSLNGVSLAITCDTGKGNSTVRQTLQLKQGYQPVALDSLQFPILYQLIQDNVPRRQVNFTVTCRYKGELLLESTKSVLWMGLTEWLDSSDTWHFIPAFVNPYDEGILRVIDHADPILKTIVSPESAFSGYQTGNKEFVKTQVKAIFQCLRDDPFHLSYINPPPLPVYTPGTNISSGQRVRSPNEVIERKRGTCHDLAILIASCLEHVGIYPLIVLIRGHTFVGFWNDSQVHQEFWRKARNNFKRQSQGTGREWTIASKVELQKLVQQDSITLMEATMVTNRNAKLEKALIIGGTNLDDPLRKYDVAIDIQASRFQIQPL